ncbi:MAG: deoxyribose-phosphate aldolase [Crocinitomicaceae bacterium]|nr:deoxyribose-phosphate aldolase [Crocinitomicaceae bacterium]
MSQKQELLKILSLIDLTSLEATDSESSISTLVEKANEGYQNHYPAAVCVYPNFGNFVRSNLKNEMSVAVVAGYFPSGQTLLHAKIAELESVNKTIAEEVDIVINRGLALTERWDDLSNEISAMRKAAPHKKLKVILETGELKSADLIRKVAEISISSGADFIKTSTGKSTVGATKEAAEVMCEVIKTHAEKTGKKIGFKPSGGIRTVEDAKLYFSVVNKILADDWLCPELFRIGASSLYDALISELKHADNK